MSHNEVKVRTIRPHDTTVGMKQPGDEYDRPANEAKELADKGVVSIVQSKPAPKAKRVAKVK